MIQERLHGTRCSEKVYYFLFSSTFIVIKLPPKWSIWKMSLLYLLKYIQFVMDGEFCILKNVCSRICYILFVEFKKIPTCASPHISQYNCSSVYLYDSCSTFSGLFKILILSSKVINTYSNLLLSISLIIMGFSPPTTQVMKMLSSLISIWSNECYNLVALFLLIKYFKAENEYL